MAKFELKLPKMGESVAEATVTNWLKEVGDTIEADEAVLEIATDKVDSEVPSEVDGVLVEKLFDTDDVVQVGQTIAIIETEGDGGEESSAPKSSTVETKPEPEMVQAVEEKVDTAKQATKTAIESNDERFYSPLVKNIAKEEGVSQSELDSISGTGKDGRVTKNDMLAYVENRGQQQAQPKQETAQQPVASKPAPAPKPAVSVNGEDEVIEMTRMGKMISKHMVDSVQTSAHVQSFVECDVTKVWNWRNKVKGDFAKREGEKLTFTPIFMEAVAKALKDYPLMNIAVDGDKILKPDEIQGGTYTVTNVGTFGSIMGTPIINQPQVGILALGAIRKVPAVIETPDGDFIGIRYKMFLSHSYDHRVVNGALGGQFVKAVANYLEAWNVNREV